MVCYARPASRLAAIMLVAWLVFAIPVRHYFDNAALVMTVTVATAGAVVAAALAFVIFMSVRRRRAAAGGCVSCQFRCQHAMTGPAMTGPGRRLWLVTIADRRPQETAADRRPPGPGAHRPAAAPGANRRAPGPGAHRPAAAPGHPGTLGYRGTAPTRSVSVLLPMPAVRSAAAAPAPAGAEVCGLTAPRWPDRPALRASQVSRRVPGAGAHIPRRERAGSPMLAALARGRPGRSGAGVDDTDSPSARMASTQNRRRLPRWGSGAKW